jgi:amino acid adenylation domain-containing protein
MVTMSISDVKARPALHSLFEQRVHEDPDRIALEYEGGQISYGELNREANRLAHYLRDTVGVATDDRVAILVEQPISAIIAIIAALKAGGAYVPIDPGNPLAVTQQILRDAAPAVLVLDSPSATSAAFFDGELFVIDMMIPNLITPTTDPPPAAVASDLAYVIYTSGTTGAPKGVAVEHRAIVNTVTWRNTYYGFSPEDASLAVSRMAFDTSVEDIFCMLTTGARLVLPLRYRITDRSYIVDLIGSRRVSRLLITPTLYRRLLPGLGEQVASRLRSVTVAGEAFAIDLVQEHYRRLPGVDLHNEYGPSENAVCSTVYAFSPDDTEVLIGGPINNTEAFVIDHKENLVDTGGTGELYLAGAGLARCYLGRSQLTEERFTAWSTSAVDTRRVYRTGDIVRVCHDGNLAFVGRADYQIKIRGQRVEPNHVTECLRRHPAVRDAVVALHPESDGSPHLVAFLIAAIDDIEQIQTAARETLPAYMVPSAIVPVDEIPVTANGKVDVAALLADYADIMDAGHPRDADFSQTEKSLLSIWQKLFPHLRISLDDDFFEAGGDSITVMDLIARIEKDLGAQMDSADAYTDRTIRRIAKRLEHKQQVVTIT